MLRSLLTICLLATVPLSAQAGTATAPAPSRIRVDTTGAGILIDQALNHSEVMQNLQYLVDVIGPRLSGSEAMRRANDWTAERFRAYGLSASLEPFNFGVTWSRGPVTARLIAPFERAVVAHSWAWTAGTGGQELSGPVIRIDIDSMADIEANRSLISGAWILPSEPPSIWNPDGPEMTVADSAAREEARRQRRAQRGDRSPEAREAARQFGIDLPYLLQEAGAHGMLRDGSKEFGLMTMSGSPNRVSPLPLLVIAHEDYAMLDRLIEMGQVPRFAARVENNLGDTTVMQWNTIGEIRGTDKPEEVVILGAHLDSWDLGTGTTDNGTGSMVVLEAARVIAQSGLKPKRTIRFILFSGEEQGLLGSRAYAAAHAGEADQIQAVLVLDNGTGRILGQALQGREELEGLWRDLLMPVASLGADRVRDANKGGTDHLAFLPYGVPGFNFDQESRGYGHTHHSQIDTYDHAVPGDLMQASAVMAVTAYELANLPELLPRGETTEVVAPAPAEPSPGLGVTASSE